MKIDWVKKLSSRKFWAALIGFAGAFLVAIGAGPESIERITAIIMSGATLIAYILAEGFVDGKSTGATQADKPAEASDWEGFI
jgi:hypothetical protein